MIGPFPGNNPAPKRRSRNRRRPGNGGVRPQNFQNQQPAGLRPAPFQQQAPVSNVRTPFTGMFTSEKGQKVLKPSLLAEAGAWVPPQLVEKYRLRPGDLVEGVVGAPRQGSLYPPLLEVVSLNGLDPTTSRDRIQFDDEKTVTVHPDQMLRCETTKDELVGRMVDLFCPIGLGQRALIAAPAKAGKTTILRQLAHSISVNQPNVKIVLCLVGERPEEVTEFSRTVPGEIHASNFDTPPTLQVAVAELAVERAKRLVELGNDVVLFIDSLTRLARAYNLESTGRDSGRTLSGGMAITALAPPKKILGAGRNIEGGASLTIIASCLIETDSRFDEVVYSELKATGNMEMVLSRQLADDRVFPAIDISKGGTRRDDLLFDKEEAANVNLLRKRISHLNGTATLHVRDYLLKTPDNKFFLTQIEKLEAAGGATRK